MKLLSPLILGVMHMAGCSVGGPSNTDVTAIEAFTSRNACVGRLDRWHREFAFAMRGNRIDTDLIDVTYVQAGHRGLEAGRFLEEPRRPSFIDDAQFRVAHGTFDRRKRQFRDWECGCNFPPYNVVGPIECRPKRRISARSQ